MATAPPSNRWYPTTISDPATHEAFRQAFDRLYTLQDKVDRGPLATATKQVGSAPAAPSAAASLTPSMLTEAPKSTISPGVLNTFYADGSYLYVYTAAGWVRAALATF